MFLIGFLDGFVSNSSEYLYNITTADVEDDLPGVGGLGSLLPAADARLAQRKCPEVICHLPTEASVVYSIKSYTDVYRIYSFPPCRFARSNISGKVEEL